MFQIAGNYMIKRHEMKIRTTVIIVAGCSVLAFLAGAWISFRSSNLSAGSTRKVLYYVDPMHPSYRSDKPGIAPDCGMQLEPVYADGSSKGNSASAALLPGTVQVSPDQLQTTGIRVATVEHGSGHQILRVTGRIVPDERRVYRLTASVTGWVQSIGKVTTGDTVKKNETLLSFYAPDFLSAIQSYIYALSSLDRSMAVQGQKPASQLDVNNVNLHNYRNTLRNLGMSDIQMDEIARTRQATENVRIVAPADGIVLTRNVFPGLKFDGSTEFFRIADLNKVWVLADVYGSEADNLKPGTKITVSLPNRNRSYTALVSSVPPSFDQNSRTLKLRLELDNPGLILRPDMFVDVELPINIPAMLSVPNEAVIDSGLKKSVFVEKIVGVFEPREVETGGVYGNRTEILSGLKVGERIAISGTFLLDSESRMKSAASGISSSPRLDPTCGMYVDEAKARTAGLTIAAGGTTNYFCSDECKQKFQKNPAAKVNHTPPGSVADKKEVLQATTTPSTDHSGHTGHGEMK